MRVWTAFECRWDRACPVCNLQAYAWRYFYFSLWYARITARSLCCETTCMYTSVYCNVMLRREVYALASKCSNVNSMYIYSLHTDISYYGLLFLCASMLQLSAVAFLPTSLIWHLMMVEGGCSIRLS